MDDKKRLLSRIAVLIEAGNGNVITMVVGADETVLGFDDHDHQDVRCYASRGLSDADEPDEPVLTQTGERTKLCANPKYVSTPLTADPTCAPVAANQCLPTASITAPA
jgi:hypothetical protein